MLHCARRHRNICSTSRHNSGRLPHLPQRGPTLQYSPIDSHRLQTPPESQASRDGNFAKWRNVPNGPTYAIRDGSVELVTPPVAARDKTLAINDTEILDFYFTKNDKLKPFVRRDEASRAKPSPAELDRIRFLIRWKSYFRQLYALLAKEDKASTHSIFASERTESMEFVGDKSFGELRQQWDKMRYIDRWEVLPRLLVGCITTSADQTLRLLRALPYISWDFQVRMDCLLFIKRAHRTEIATKPSLQHDFTFLVRKLLRSWRWPLFKMKTRHLGIILEHCTTTEISHLINSSITADAIPDQPTTLALVDYFTRHKDYERVLSILRILPRELIAASPPLLLQRCTNLLKLDFVVRQGSSQNFKILPELLQLGVRPDVILHNIVIQNACAAGMPGVAWDLFRYMQAERLKIDSVTYLILLKDNFTRRDVRGLNEILTAIHHREDLSQDPYLVALTMNIVRVICRERDDSPETAFSHLLAVYDRAFDRRELIRLGMARQSVSLDNRPALPQPNPNSLAFVIWAYVLVQKQSGFVDVLWSHLVGLIRRADQTIVNAAKHSYLYDGFVLFYGRHPRTLPKVLSIIQYMLSHNLCQPTATTWLFAISAFLRHGQSEIAERIRDEMMERGLLTNAKNWQFILSRWPHSDVAEQARSALEWEAMKVKPPLQTAGLDGLFEDSPTSEDQTPAWARSEIVYSGWNELIDLRPNFDPPSPDTDATSDRCK